MTTRRSHKKSRWGCKRCKTRRMKCDEVHPVCGGCVKAGVKCDFGLLSNVSAAPPPLQCGLPSAPSSRTGSSEPEMEVVPNSTDLQLVSSNNSNYYPPTPMSSPVRSYYPPTPSSSPVIPYQVGTPPENMLDLRLFHHYIQMTTGGYINSFQKKVGDKSTHDVRAKWFNWVVGLAADSRHLMDALLSLAAFHLRYRNAGDTSITDAGHRYMTRAIEGHSKQLRDGITPDNAEEIFATSTCVTFYVSSGRHLPSTGEQDLLHWFQPWQGMRAVLQNCWSLIKTKEIKNLIQHEHTLELLQPGINSEHYAIPETFNFLLDDMAFFDSDLETIQAYETSVGYLNKIYAHSANRNILKFPGMVTKRYVDLVEMKDPRALAILGYYFMLLIQIEQIWWLQGAAERDFTYLMKELPAEWQPKMAWAMSEFLVYDERCKAF